MSAAVGRPPRGADHVVWIGHATVLLELAGVRLITDPLLRRRVGPLRRQVPAPAPGLLEGLDGVLISHLHLDHLDLGSLRRLGHRLPIVAPRGAGRLLARHGFADVREVTAGDAVAFGAVTVTAVPAAHDGHRLPHGAFAEPLGFVVAAGRRVYFAGDTALFAGMAELAGDLDVALLPVWGWGPTLGPGHLDPRGAAEALALLRPVLAVPIHWGTYFPLGLAPLFPATLSDPPCAFARAAAVVAPGVRVRVLAPGEALSPGAPVAAAGAVDVPAPGGRTARPAP